MCSTTTPKAEIYVFEKKIKKTLMQQWNFPKFHLFSDYTPTVRVAPLAIMVLLQQRRFQFSQVVHRSSSYIASNSDDDVFVSAILTEKNPNKIINTL